MNIIKYEKKQYSVLLLFFKWIIITALVLVFLYPLVFTLIVSFKAKGEVWSNFFGLPQRIHFRNYVDAWKRGNIGRSTFNSLYITVVTVILQLLFSSMIAFLLVRVKIPFNRFLFAFFSIGVMIPLHAVVLPIARRAVQLHMSDSHLYLILVYTAGGIPWFVFLMTGYMKSIPVSLEEAAMLDGSSLEQIFFRIVLPLSRPVLLTCSILAFLGSYNELLLAMVLLKSRIKLTIPVALSAFTGFHSVNFPELTAAVIISILPTIILYVVFQGKVESGLAAGAVKG